MKIKMSGFKFAVVLNLSNFFSDHRHRVRICIDDKIKTVKDLQDKITTVFGVRNFILTSRNEYLPHTEDIQVLRSDDIIWVIPSDDSRSIENNTVNTESYIPNTSRRKRSLNTSNTPEDVRLVNKKCKNEVFDQVEDEVVNDQWKMNGKKKKKKRSKDIEEKTTNKKIKKHKDNVEESKNVSKRNLESPEHIGKEFAPINGSLPVGNNYVNPDPPINIATSLPHRLPYKKASLVPTTTNKYLQENKINIVKIDYIKKPTVELQQNEKESTAADAATSQTPMEMENEKDVIDSTVSNKKNTELLPINGKESTYVSKTKYFFLDTPPKVNQEKPSKKRKNFFIKEGMFSPLITKNTVPDIVMQVDENSVTSPKQTSEEIYTLSDENIDVHDQQILDETKICDAAIDAAGNTIVSETGIEDSCYIDKISPCHTTLLDNSEVNCSTSIMSGVVPFSFSTTKRKYISGVGHLLSNLRDSDTLDTTANSDTSEFITQRRRRTRKRQKKSKNNDSMGETDLTQNLETTGTMKTFAAPKIHIKFPENDNESNLKTMPSGTNESCSIYNESDRSNNDKKKSSIISIGNESGSTVSVGSESKVKTSEQELIPVLPKIGNVISFKVLKMSEDFTPEISSHIMGNVKQYDADTKIVTFRITSGIEELQAPKGKFFLDDEDDQCSSSDLKEFLWTDLIEPKLIYP